MPRAPLFCLLLAFVVNACAPQPHSNPRAVAARTPQRVVSLDYCADQFVLRLADRTQIAALSPDADSAFSYMADAAEGLAQAPATAEAIIAARPDLVVRTYGGGPRIAEFLARANIPVLQLGYADDVDGIARNIADAAAALGHPRRGDGDIALLRARIADARRAQTNRTVLYVTPGGVTTGPGSMIHDIIAQSGYRNYMTRPGWNPLPLESLPYEAPDIVLFASFGAEADDTNRWSPTRHGLAQRALAQTRQISINGAATACAGWFIADIADALAGAPR
ncbi:MAG: ABC transporter substrate-binding protein [Alphaproteobacteria bacterium]|nr:ABC transporter substrate-binding protein [Alphaproteobacteria bacterium]